MEQFVLISASVCNKSLKIRAVTKEEFPKYQHLQNPTCQIDSLEKEIDNQLSAKTDPLVDKIFFCPRIKLSNSQILILDGVETAVLLSDFAQQVRRKNADVLDIYFTLFGAAVIPPTLVLSQNSKALKREIEKPGSHSKFELQMLQRLKSRVVLLIALSTI